MHHSHSHRHSVVPHGGSNGHHTAADPETQRLAEDASRQANWKRWGPYLSDRQWGTVREDYSESGDCWNHLSHDHARSRAYRWGEDGILGICDRQCRLCFGLALWNGRDPIIKERLFGLTNGEGNHGEDVKECYFHLDASPTASYLRGLYKYPQAEFPYARLVDENRRRSLHEREFELVDSGVFDDDRYFDCEVEYAKSDPEHIAIRITAHNRGHEAAPLWLLPTIWFRNTWSWGRQDEEYAPRPRLCRLDASTIEATHETLGRYRLEIDDARVQAADRSEACPPVAPELLFTENESNTQRLWAVPNAVPFVKDAFHRHLIEREAGAVNPDGVGTKAAPLVAVRVPAGGSVVLRLRLRRLDAIATDRDGSVCPDMSHDLRRDFGRDFDALFDMRRAEAEAHRRRCFPGDHCEDERAVIRQACAGLVWTKQSFHYVVREWLDGDPAQPAPPASRRRGRNADWSHVHCRDVLSVPDKWEYPWFAAWDLAFHAVAFARIDADFAKHQLLLLLREWYMHPNGQIPAYEFAFDDVNPPVHAWACWNVYRIEAERGRPDRDFLARVFQKLLLNFTWWVNRKDVSGKHVFAGGFLGLDNIGVFDRSRPLPTGGHLEQADGTAWMAIFCTTMLAMAIELARHDPTYEDIASKLFEHFTAIADAMNTLGGSGLWDELDGFYYDQLNMHGQTQPLRVRSMVGLLPLAAALVIEQSQLEKLPGFAKRWRWFMKHRGDLARHVAYGESRMDEHRHEHHLLAIPSIDRLRRTIERLLDEGEFLAPHGLRSVSRVHAERPFEFRVGDEVFRVPYTSGESTSNLFGGNSNWRGPIWFPVNFLLVEALDTYHHFLGDHFTVEMPRGSGRRVTLGEAARELRRRLTSLFLKDRGSHRPCHGGDRRFAADPHWRDLLLFHEYFDGDDGRGLGASHQTGWTALAVNLLHDLRRSGTHHECRAQRPAAAATSAAARLNAEAPATSDTLSDRG